MKKFEGEHLVQKDYIARLTEYALNSEGRTKAYYKKLLQEDKRNRLAFVEQDLNKEGKTYKYITKHIEKTAKKHSVKAKANSFKEAEKLLREVDLRAILGVKVDLKEVFTTDLFLTYKEKKEEELYVNNTSIGYRIFFKRNKFSYTDDGEVETFETSLDIIDLYKMLFDTRYYETMEELAKMFKIEIKNEFKYRQAQKEKFADNMIALGNIEKYPNLSELISKNLIVLKELNFKSLMHSLTVEKSYKGETVFFAPTRDFSKEMKELGKQVTEGNKEIKTLSSTSVGRLFQLYRVLGLIEVVKTENVPQSLLVSAPTQKLHIEPVYYLIPRYSSVFLEKAERIAKKLVKGDFKIADICYETILKILGKKLADDVYEHVTDRIAKEDYINNVLNVIAENEGKEKILYGKAKRANTIAKKKEAKANGTYYEDVEMPF